MTRVRRKPLSPTTVKNYTVVLVRAFGPKPYNGKADLSEWTPASLKMLRAAALRFAPERFDDIPDEEYAVARVIKPPTEAELAAVELAAEGEQAARRGLALLPLGLGLRAFEVLNLKRKDVQQAANGEEMLCLRKGGREQLLPAAGVRPLLEDLLTAEWDYSWQILSGTSASAAYQTFYRLVRDLGRKAGVKGMRPHKLRHGFATRMERAGASLPQIQVMMDHSSPEMTMRYVHPENKDISKHLQQMKRRKKLWDSEEIRILLTSSGLPFNRSRPEEYDVIARELNTGLISIEALPISLIVDPTIKVALSPGEKDEHRGLKQCVVAWLRARGETKIETERIYADRSVDVRSENFVVECGDTEAEKLQQTFNISTTIRWAIFPRQSELLHFDGFPHVDGGQIFVFTNLGGTGRWDKITAALRAKGQAVMKGLCEELEGKDLE